MPTVADSHHSHIPVNHHLRPLYRTLAGLCGLYVLVFGIVGAVQTNDRGWFAREGVWVLGLRTNLAFSVLSVVVGALVLLGLLIGRNVDRTLNVLAGVTFLLAGMAMLVLLRTSANVLNFSVATCVVSFVIGLVVGTAGLYSTVGSVQRERTGEAFRHGGWPAGQAAGPAADGPAADGPAADGSVAGRPAGERARPSGDAVRTPVSGAG
jgi:uncharacterized protein DUF4383